MTFISENNLAALVGTSNQTVRRWSETGVYKSYRHGGMMGFDMSDLENIPEVRAMLESRWEEESDTVPLREYTSVELFAGAGGLALGMSLAGFTHVLLNEFDSSACKTLRANRPDWHVVEGDVRHLDFTPLRGKVDFLSGGFPCQAFSYAGKQGGFSDTRGTLFFELARAVKEINPKVFMGENVKGLLSHDDGRTFETIRNTISELGYTLVSPKVLKAIMYQVPQKRERLILIAIRNDISHDVTFHWPSPYSEVLTLRDALFRSKIYDTDVPSSEGVVYPPKKREVLSLVPQGGDWRSLPEDVAKIYLGGSWVLGGGKTGMARRLSLDEPSLTLTCSPCQKQTERCHPTETRPLTIREYARIQTFPDYWDFKGTMNDKYKQIGNAVPVNLAWALGRSLIRLFNDIQTVSPTETYNCDEAVATIMREQSMLMVSKDDATQTSKLVTSCKQLNFLDLFGLYGCTAIADSGQCHDAREGYGVNVGNGVVIESERRCLICLIHKDFEKPYHEHTATVIYTGRRFPASVDLTQMFYFMPYLKGKGIKDLYRITSVRLTDMAGDRPNGTPKDLQLAFEIRFVGQVFNDYVPTELDLMSKYSDKCSDEIIGIWRRLQGRDIS